MLDTVARAEGPAEVFNAVWKVAVQAGACCCTWIAPGHDRVAAIREAVSVGPLADGCRELVAAWGASDEVLSRAQPTSIIAPPPDTTDPTVLAFPPRITAVFALPLLVQGRVAGSLAFGTWSQEGFTAQQHGLLSCLTAEFASACRRDLIANEVEPDAPEPHAAWDSIPAMVFGLDNHGSIVFANRAAKQVLGLSGTAFTGMGLQELFSGLVVECDMQQVLGRARQSAEPVAFTTPVHGPDGLDMAIHWSLSAVEAGVPPQVSFLAAGAIGDGAGHTSEEIKHRERLSSVGTMLASAAHELKNPLTAAIGSAELLDDLLVSEGPERKHVRNVLTQAHRACRIASSLLTLARGEGDAWVPVSLNDLAQQVHELLHYQLRQEGVDLQVRLQAGLPSVLGDAGELLQVLVNLVTNAQQALRGRRDAIVLVRTDSVGGKAQITVQDNGTGIARDVLPMVFDPFVTTKPQGEGTGLGLSIARSIVQQHGGDICARNRPEGGAAFSVALPCLSMGSGESRMTDDGACADDAVAPKSTRPARVLIIDDEEPIRMVLVEALMFAGHEADGAKDGETGLSLATTKDYDLILCDFRMPVLGGEEFFHELHEHKPEAAQRVIFTTGDASSDKSREFLHKWGLECLHKPFSTKHVVELARLAVQNQ